MENEPVSEQNILMYVWPFQLVADILKWFSTFWQMRRPDQMLKPRGICHICVPPLTVFQTAWLHPSSQQLINCSFSPIKKRRESCYLLRLQPCSKVVKSKRGWQSAKRSGIHDQISRISFTLTISDLKFSAWTAKCTFCLRNTVQNIERQRLNRTSRLITGQQQEKDSTPNDSTDVSVPKAPAHGIRFSEECETQQYNIACDMKPSLLEHLKQLWPAPVHTEGIMARQLAARHGLTSAGTEVQRTTDLQKQPEKKEKKERIFFPSVLLPVLWN